MEKGLKKYIDSMSSDGREELRQLLQQTSSVDRYSLLMNVRGDKYRGNTGPHIAANYNDLEKMKYMFEGFTGDKKFDVLKIKVEKSDFSALHYAAWNNHSSIITYLLTDLSQQQKFKLLKLQKKKMETRLYMMQHLGIIQKQFKLSLPLFHHSSRYNYLT